MALFIVISIITILVSAAKVVALRRRCNQRMLQDWKQSFTVPPVGDASGLPASKATGAGMEI